MNSFIGSTGGKCEMCEMAGGGLQSRAAGQRYRLYLPCRENWTRPYATAELNDGPYDFRKRPEKNKYEISMACGGMHRHRSIFLMRAGHDAGPMPLKTNNNVRTAAMIAGPV